MEELNSKKQDAGGPREKQPQELAELRRRLDEEQRESARLRLEMDRLKAAQDRARNRAPYRSLLENMNDVVMRFDRQLRLIYVNPAIEAQTGRPAAEFLGKFLYESPLSCCDVLYRKILRKLERVFQTAEPDTLEYEHPALPDHRHLHDHLIPERSADGRVQTVLVISHDITELKRAEQALRESEEQFRRVVMNAPIPVLVYAEDGRLLAMSRTVTALTGYTRREIRILDDWLRPAYRGSPPSKWKSTGWYAGCSNPAPPFRRRSGPSRPAAAKIGCGCSPLPKPEGWETDGGIWPPWPSTSPRASRPRKLCGSTTRPWSGSWRNARC
jgi:PAS domain S-box-containing protein